MEVSGGKITELAANIIAEFMNVQCDVNINNCSALGVEDQKIVVKGKKLLESQEIVGIFVANEGTRGVISSQGVAPNPQSRLPNIP